MDFLNSLLILLIGTAYTLLGTPHAPIYSRVPFESLEPVCATNTPRTELDKSLCEQVGWGPREEWPSFTNNHFEVTSQICDSTRWWNRRRDKFSAPFNQAYFANGTTWKSILIKGPWQSVEKSLECLVNETEVISVIEKIGIDIGSYPLGQVLSSMRYYGVPLPRSQDLSSGARTLLHTLSRAENLKTLEIYIPTDVTTEYDQVMKNSTIDPPIQATRIVLGPLAEGIMRHMPKVNDISINGWNFCDIDNAQQRMMRAIMGTQLEHLELCADDNLSSHIEAIRNGIPSLKRLSFLSTRRIGNITTYTSLLKNFTGLIEINLPRAWRLDDDLRHSNPFMDDIDVITQKAKESKQKLLSIVQEDLPFLERVSFGGEKHDYLTQNDDSKMA